MRFVVSSAQLLKNLQKISGVISTNTVLPILEDFLFDIEKNKLTITATDLDTTMSVGMDIESKENFKKQSVKMVTEAVQKAFENNPTFTLEYYQIADEETLLPCIRKTKNKKYRAFIAVFVNKIRLIDTISLN